VDGHIGEIVLLAAQQLNRALQIKGPRPSWQPERGAEILGDLRSALGAHRDETAAHKAHTIRYTPITESYRPLIELSLSILARKPRAPSAGGSAKAYGILLDMAEIWELYVAKLLRAGLPGFRVLHTGRVSQSFKSLLIGQHGQMLGSLRPDILIQDDDDQCLGIADAKYKNTRVRAEHINGVVREDLYQLAAYLSGFGDQEKDLDGFLIYPEDIEGQVSLNLAPNNPWQFTAGSRRKLWFLSVNGTDTLASAGITNNEQILLNQIEAALLQN
jgi:5-methylcytosine-specific restriction enzyme subunit McrC